LIFKVAPMTRLSLLSFAAAMTIILGAALIPEPALSGDMYLKAKPVVRQDAPSDWRTRLFEQYRRYLQRKAQ
jgi:hypothetical protein